MDTPGNNLETETVSRRTLLTGSAALLAGGALGSMAKSLASPASATTTVPAEAPPLPWKWAKLDPLEAGRRAYRPAPHQISGGARDGFGFRTLLPRTASPG